MPQSADKHRRHIVYVSSPLPLAVAAKWYVHIIAQPRGKRYVPATPKIGKIARLIREIEVLSQSEAHNQGDTYCHITVS